jgi:BASS family bile acid:Na+ symporter
LITNVAIGWFDPFDDQLGMQFGKTLDVFAIVLVPVVLGMLVRRRSPGGWTDRCGSCRSWSSWR